MYNFIIYNVHFIKPSQANFDNLPAKLRKISEKRKEFNIISSKMIKKSLFLI